jgi:hypothetical protein
MVACVFFVGLAPYVVVIRPRKAGVRVLVLGFVGLLIMTVLGIGADVSL